MPIVLDNKSVVFQPLPIHITCVFTVYAIYHAQWCKMSEKTSIWESAKSNHQKGGIIYLSEDEGVPGRRVSVPVVGEPQALGQTQAGQYTIPLP